MDIHLFVSVKSTVTDIISVLKEISRSVKNLCLIKKTQSHINYVKQLVN